MSAAERNLLNGSAEMQALVADHDWSATPLGARERWGDALTLSVSLCLNSRFPLILWWGPELTMIYNDSYVEHLQSKHPWALGKPGSEVWSEIWDVIGPMLDGVMKTGVATWNDDLQLFLQRNGFAEETYHTFSYSAIKDRTGKIVGVFTPVSETTQRVLSARRVATLKEIGITKAETEKQLNSKLESVLASNRLDLPLAALFGVYPETGNVRCLISDPDTPELSRDELPSKLREAISFAVKTGESVIGQNISAILNHTPKTNLGSPPTSYIVIPNLSHHPSESFVLVTALSPHLPFDDSYKTFLENTSRALSSAIRERRALEEEKRRAEELIELDRAKTQFFNNISHEFRTPLTLMIGALEQAADARKTLEESQVSLLYRNAQRLLKLVNTLLDFSRIEAGRYSASFVKTDLRAFTSDIAGAFRSAIESSGLSFDVDCEDISESVFVDRDMWEKIVLNLLSNALKYTLAGRIALTLKENGDEIILEVSDTGSGISREDLPKVFERFTRLKTSKGRTQEGSGIGLAFVRELVKMHNGSISAESVVGQGTTFKVIIPKGTAHLEPAWLGDRGEVSTKSTQARAYVQEALSWDPSLEKNESSRAPEWQPYTILIVDDNADMRSYLSRLLQPYWQINIARNGATALEEMLKNPPDLVVTDVMMPEMDGFELIQQMRQREVLAKVPVIVLSARAGEEARVDGLKRGADDYLTKPFSTHELVARIRKLLQTASDSSHLQGLIDERTKEMEIIGGVLTDFVDVGDFRNASKRILSRALEITRSEYGFIGATVPGGPNGSILRVFADLGFEWSARQNRELYEKIIADYETKGYIEFPMLDNLFGWPILNRKPIVTNDPANDERRSGRQPAGHPPTNSFMGLPIMKGETVVGAIGMANKPGGYSDADIGKISHLMSAASVIYDSYRRLQYEHRIIQERTIAEDNLRKANEALLELSYSVSHELQEPLATLRGDLSLLSARYKDRLGTDADRFINDALKSNAKINAMIDDLWIYARIDRGNSTMQTVSLNELFDKTLITMEAEIKAKSATIARDDLPVLTVDGEEIAVLLQRLLDNALKFSNEQPKIELTAKQLVDEWLFCMSDNGIGFLQTEAHEIFKMFRKLSRNSAGTGMGLPIAKRIIEYHGGRIWAESEPGKGAKLFFSLPIVAKTERPNSLNR